MYILIIIIWSVHSYSPATISSVEFTNKAACITALESIYKARQLGSNKALNIWCFKK